MVWLGGDCMDKFKHSRGDLESDFSLSSNKARRLCEVLEGEINEHWTEKKYNKHWYDDYFYSAFQRMVDLIDRIKNRRNNHGYELKRGVLAN